MEMGKAQRNGGMKPTRAQYFFARGRPVQFFFILFFVGGPLCFAYTVAGLLAHVYEPLSDTWNLLRVVFYVIIAVLLGFLLTLVAGSCLAGILWPILRPLYRARCARNGAPFQPGDHVQILVGRHKGRVVRVYGGWRDDSVRVELSETEKEKLKDIFSAIQLLRESAEQNTSATDKQG